MKKYIKRPIKKKTIKTETKKGKMKKAKTAEKTIFQKLRSERN